MRTLLLLIALTCAAPAPAQTELKTFKLQNRSAEEIIGILRPLLDPRGGISGTGYTLLVRSTPQNLREIEQMVRELDTALRNLRITVRRGELSESERMGIRGSGEVRAGDGKVILGPGGTPRVHIQQGERRGETRSDQQLRALEGQWAQIRSGQEMPVPQRSVTQVPGGVVVQDSTAYRDVSSGFEVRPRLSGQQVFVDVRPFSARPVPGGGGAVETSAIVTTVSGRLGEWIELGGVMEESQSRSRGLTQSTQQRSSQSGGTYIRIDIAE